MEGKKYLPWDLRPLAVTRKQTVEESEHKQRVNLGEKYEGEDEIFKYVYLI